MARLHRLAVAVRIDAGEAAVVTALTGRLVHLALVGALAGIPLPIAAGLPTGIAFGISRLALLAPPILLIERPLLLLRGLPWITMLCHYSLLLCRRRRRREGNAGQRHAVPMTHRNWCDRNQSMLATVYRKAPLRVTGGM
jgi:hypothetical protein